MIELSFTSTLHAPAARVWAHASDMAGVNYELAPLVRMHLPAALRGKTIADAPLGEVAFHSWLFAGGVVPFDRHALRLVALDPGAGFVEESSSLVQRVWRHERRIAPASESRCVLTDRLGVEPRIAAAAPLVRAAVTQIFRHRHRRLRALFSRG